MGRACVIFDCDGVLIDSEIISARMLIEALATRGVVIDLPYVARHFLGRSYPAHAYEAMANPLISGFLDKFEREDIIPCVAPVPLPRR